MSTPTISILIPTYNRCGLLKEALGSARAQDHPHLEIVVSDNASTDGTPDLKAHYTQDPRIRWYRNPENIGLAGNWRKLLYDYARTDYVMILTDDDYLENPRHISEAARVIDAHHVDLVVAGTHSYDEETGSLIDRSWDLPEILTTRWWLDNIGRGRKGQIYFPHTTTVGVFRLEKAKSLNAYINPVFGMDFQLGLQLALSGPTGYLRGIRSRVRRHVQNDGFTAPLDVVMTSLQLYERVMSYGLSLGLPREEVRIFCVRFMYTVVRSFILYAWSYNHGPTWRSFRALYGKLAEVDPELARVGMLTPGALIRFFIGSNPKRQQFLRRMYYKIRFGKAVFRAPDE